MKRILYTLLGMMLSIGAWAQTLQEQINSAEAGTTVTLSEDVTLTERIDIKKNITVDLGGYTIKPTATCGNGSAFNIVSGTVTIQNGTIDASFGESNNGETDAITARSGSDVTLKDLNITVKSKNGACAYAFEGSKITIKSGVYENQTTETYQYNANITAMVVNQANVATQLIFIEGGTFKGYDPTLGDDSQTANENATFLAEGVALQKDASGNYETTTAVAKIGGKNYATIKDAITAATEGQIVTLLTDINEAVENTNAHNFTIDLNGKTWTSDATSTFKNNGGTVTITDATGNGTIKNTANAKDMGIAVWARTGSVVIEKGTFISQSNYEATLYVGTTNANLGGKQPTINVKGGTFKNEATGKYAYKDSLLPLTLNVYNTITDYQAIIISGGTFYGNDPALGDDNMGTGIPGGNFLADGYVPVKDAEGHYTVVESSYVAQIDDVKYISLSDALVAATEGKTITLLADINEAVKNTNTCNFTIDLNGKNWTATDAFTNNGGTVTFIGEGTVKATAADGVAVWARTGSIIINGGNYENCSNEEATVYVGTKNESLGGKKPKVIINGGSFKNTAEGVYKWNTNLLPLTLNVHNDISDADTYQAIVINGGKFFGNDPSIGDDKQLNKINNNSNFVSSELHAELKDGVFVIKEGGYIAQVGYLKFLSLDEAIAKAIAEQTITLFADAIATEELPANVTIDAASHALTLPSFYVADGAGLSYAKVINATENTYKVTTASYNRTGATGTQWGTACLPFSFESAPDGYTLYTPTAVGDNVLTISEVSYPVVAGTPVIFHKSSVAEATMTLTSSEAKVKIGATPLAQAGSIALVGTFSQQNITEELPSIYFINTDKFHQAQASLTVPAYRAYIKNTSAGAKPRVLSIVVDEDATAVESLDANAEIIAIYDASSRQLTAPKKGLNIMKLSNGKTAKLFVK